jgi:hypothetical protein
MCATFVRKCAYGNATHIHCMAKPFAQVLFQGETCFRGKQSLYAHIHICTRNHSIAPSPTIPSSTHED